MVKETVLAPSVAVFPKRAGKGVCDTVVGTDNDIPQDADPRIFDAYEYWRGIRNDIGRLPSRHDIDPLDLPAQIWPNLILSDLIPDPFSVLYKVVGTAVVELDGFDTTGMRIEDTLPRRKIEDVLADYRTVATRRQPHFRRVVLYDERLRNDIDVERMHLPLATDGRNVDKTLTVFVRLDTHWSSSGQAVSTASRV